VFFVAHLPFRFDPIISWYSSFNGRLSGEEDKNRAQTNVGHQPLPVNRTIVRSESSTTPNFQSKVEKRGPVKIKWSIPLRF